MQEQSLVNGWSDDRAAEMLPDEPKEKIAYCMSQVQHVANLRRQGWDIAVEEQVAIDGINGACDYNAKERMIRCKIDVRAINQQIGHGLFIDWKTGKSKGDAIQLHLNAICTAAWSGIRHFTGVFCYIDQLHISIMQIALPDEALKPALFNRAKLATGTTIHGTLQETFILMDQLREAQQTGVFYPKKNKLCGWCEIEYCEYHKSKR